MTEMRGLSFSTTVSAGASDKNRYTVPKDATIEKLSIRIYPGAETDLEIAPEIIKFQTDTVENLVRFEGKQFVDGDDDIFTWDLSVPVEKDDIIQVRANNQDDSNPYDYRVNLDIDERGGLESFVTEVL